MHKENHSIPAFLTQSSLDSVSSASPDHSSSAVFPSKNKAPVVAAISGGPDSMALLGWLEAHEIDYVIAHVNYHKRQSSGRDEQIVRNWAKQHSCPLWILHPVYSKAAGNFQGWARVVRYAFFKQIGHVYGTRQIYVGHQQDDSLETWMMQKKRGLVPERYGLEFCSPFGSFELVRPLLDHSKASLQAWCDEHGIAYGLDESNFSNAYLRNQLRHSLIETATCAQRQKWLDEMDADNRELAAMHAKAEKLALDNDFKAMQNSELGWLALEKQIALATGVHHSKAFMSDLLEKLGHGSMQTLKSEQYFGSSDSFLPIFGPSAFSNGKTVSYMKKEEKNGELSPWPAGLQTDRKEENQKKTSVCVQTDQKAPILSSLGRVSSLDRLAGRTCFLETCWQKGHLQSLHFFALSLGPSLAMRSGSDKINVQIVDNKVRIAPAGWICFYVDSKDQLEALIQAGFQWGPWRFSSQGSKIDSFVVDESDFPLFIRFSKPDDSIRMRFGTKKLNRLWIDRKIPAIERVFNPLIEGRKGILFVTFAGADPSHFMENASMHMLKLHT